MYDTITVSSMSRRSSTMHRWICAARLPFNIFVKVLAGRCTAISGNSGGHYDRLVQFADSTTVAYLQDLRIWHSVCWDGGYVLCHSDKWWPFTLFADGNDENHDCLDVDDVRAGVCQCNRIIRGHNYSDEPANVIVRVVKLLKPGTPGSVIRLDVE